MVDNTVHAPFLRRTVLILLLMLAPLSAGHADAPARSSVAKAPSSRTIDVLHYAARLDPDLPEKKVRGRVLISLVIVAPATREIVFDAGELSVDKVQERGVALEFEKVERQVRIQLPEPAAAGTTREIEILYHGAPRFGLEFHPERGELYTIFSTSQWLVCIDAPEERATLDLSVALPAGLMATGNGRLVSKSALDAGRELYHWRQETPIPSFIYGFAAGRYAETRERVDGVDLRYLSAALSPGELRRIFADTADMLRFFGRRAGIRYRGDYTQALVAETFGQELAGFALLSEAYGREVLADQTAESLVAHEAAHQWWGNMVTCRDWNHFWLNEGFATFMAAAYLQQRFGEAVYRKRVDAWERRLEKLRASGTDRALVSESWTKPSADDRAVVYQKGAYVLHLLRGELGERAFWRGIRTYTRANYGRSVATTDFKRAMERSSGRDLSGFFARWVEGTAAPSSTAPVVQ